MKPVFALIDCNNFFVSCERLFRPDLEGKPVVVLSSNDGCAVARSNEAKRLGIPMGAPAFKYRQLFKEQGVTQFSANFELYGDISDRITRFLCALTPHIEVYSVDESFLDLSELKISDYTAWGQKVKAAVMQAIGVPVSIGIAPSKTLAKLAAERAKKDDDLSGVLDLTGDEAVRDRQLLATPINDIWGVGWRLAPKLKAEAIYTALDLARMRPRLAQQLMGINGRQLVSELNGLSCYPLEPAHKVRQSVMNGRMFGEDTSEIGVLEAAIASLTARATYRLRREGLLARSAVISLSTNRYKPGYQRLSRFISFNTPLADTGAITSHFLEVLIEMIRPNVGYHRANILLYDLVSASSLQADLFGNTDLAGHDQRASRMKAFDAINSRYGRTTIRYAAEDLSQRWEPKHQLRSPRYTSDWQELPIARII